MGGGGGEGPVGPKGGMGWDDRDGFWILDGVTHDDFSLIRTEESLRLV